MESIVQCFKGMFKGCGQETGFDAESLDAAIEEGRLVAQGNTEEDAAWDRVILKIYEDEGDESPIHVETWTRETDGTYTHRIW